MRTILKIELVWLVCVLFMGACSWASYGNYDINTTRKALLIASTETSGANLLLQDLIKRNAIPTDKATIALASLRETHSTIIAALDILDTTGDPATAQDALTRATRGLDAALAILALFDTGSQP